MLNENWEHGKMQGTQTYYDPNGNVVMKAGGVLLVGHEDLGEMNWEDAMAACEAMGDGWHLPTKDELNVLYQNKDAIGGFASSYYWSSTETGTNGAWQQSFNSGNQGSTNEIATYYVRAVRAF